jgi:hypothetical protein
MDKGFLENVLLPTLPPYRGQTSLRPHKGRMGKEMKRGKAFLGGWV